MSGVSELYDVFRRVNVWAKGRVIPGRDPAEWRCDDYGSLMRFASYSDRGSEYGWEIDHLRPLWAFGADTVQNMRPLHWRNSRKGGLLPPIPVP